MKKQQEINKLKNNQKSISELTNDKKLIFFIQEVLNKAKKEHKKKGVVVPKTFFVHKEKQGADITKVSTYSQNGNSKEMYFHFVHVIETVQQPEYMISVSEAFSLNGYDINEVVKQYGSIGKHPEALDILNINVKANGEVYFGQAIVEGKKIFPVDWHKQEELYDCNFTSFSSNA
ncbi:MAG: hypothetical protein K2W92_02880 [Alphaproteobacteria bacterium]|nr:hypothetical protein [Alphaproteobacteria bacterium]